MRFVWIFLIFSIGVFAADVPKKRKPGSTAPIATIWTSGSVRSVKAHWSDQKGVVVLDRKMQDENLRNDGLLPPFERDRLFDRLGLAAKVAKMDQYQRDCLILDVRYLDSKQLTRRYPAWSAAEFTKLSNALKAIK